MTTVSVNNNTLELHFADFITAGYGHKKVTVELFFNGDYKKFSATTTRVDLTDDASELEGDERFAAIYDIISGQIEHEVIEWMENN
ncbi:MAG: hypothetical protein KAF40_01955 [Flavihumibacter sp.]|nr:hypothetical protein [Flavihumibacter sp.]